MKLRFISLIGFVFIIGLFLSSCGPRQAVEPTFTTSATITATVFPTQTDIPTPEPTVTPEATSTPSLLQGQLSGLAVAPYITVDSTGLHITLPDSSRVVDVTTENVEKQIVFDSEYSLYKIYDADGNISAEYDPGQGKEGDVDYVPATGWVDVQKLANNLVCGIGSSKTCINNYSNSHVQNSAWLQFTSTGVFRYLEVMDPNTGKDLGKVSLLGIASRDNDQNPVTLWLLVQAVNNSNPGNNLARIMAQIHFIKEGLGFDYDKGKIFLPTDYLQWLPKGISQKYSFNRTGDSYVNALKKIFNKPDSTTSTFLDSGGKNTTKENIILLTNGN